MGWMTAHGKDVSEQLKLQGENKYEKENTKEN